MRDELILTKHGFIPNKFDNREKASSIFWLKIDYDDIENNEHTI